MDVFLVIGIGFLAFVGIALFIVLWEARRSGRMVSEWAEEHGYEVLEKRQPLINLGPSPWEDPQGRAFYRVTIRDAGAKTRGGWFSCGLWPPGPHFNKVEMRWNAGESPDAAIQYGPEEEGVWPPPPTL